MKVAYRTANYQHEERLRHRETEREGGRGDMEEEREQRAGEQRAGVQRSDELRKPNSKISQNCLREEDC